MSTNGHETAAVPPEWPPEVAERYTPVRVLGHGGFASVMLARDKNKKTLVAMKVVGQNKTNTRQQSLAYAHREVDILRELSHPNIMKVLDSWEVPSSEEKSLPSKSNNTVCVMALQYYKGPTVESLLQYGGALSNKFGRVVIAQVMDAVAYLHYRAVVHRDIKPDNLIVTGALSKDDEVWDNPSDHGKNDSNLDLSEPNWEMLLQKWKVTLIDFGFARHLTPEDVKKPTAEIRRENLKASFHPHSMDIDAKSKSSCDESRHSTLDISRHSIIRFLSRDDPGNVSLSHLFRRRMSALGNRNFTAPEIINHVEHDKKPPTGTPQSGSDFVDVNNTISEYVADYGLMVDSYSLGFTIRYMMTGVPPHMTVEEAIQEQESMCYKICRGGSSKPGIRSIRYKRMSELPEEVQRLVRHLTDCSESNRISIRKARRTYPWISEVLSSTDQASEEQSHSLAHIAYLPLVLPKKKEEITAA